MIIASKSVGEIHPTQWELGKDFNFFDFRFLGISISNTVRSKNFQFFPRLLCYSSKSSECMKNMKLVDIAKIEISKNQ